MPNVQITDKELSYVWIHVNTGRIMGFLPEGWNLTGCFSIPLNHAPEADKWYRRYREQCAEEFVAREYEKNLREAPGRKKLRDELRARRNVVSPQNRAMIDRALLLLDKLEKGREKQQQGAALVEMYDASKRKEDIALDSPAFQSPAAS